MKKSITKRIAVTFILLMIITLVAIGVLEWFCIDGVYIRDKQKKLIESWKQISQMDTTSEIPETFEHYCTANNLSYCITDSSLSTIETNMRDDSQIASHLFGVVLGKEEKNTKTLKKTDDYSVIEIHDRFMDLDYLELWSTLDDGGYYMVHTPLQSIADTAKLSIKFYSVVGIAAIIVSAIIIWYLTRKIVEPVKELTDLSKKMANLDFDARYTSGGEDEIGELGKNFNAMSEELEKAVSDLKSANVKLQKDIEEKTQIDEMRQEFLSNVSHELKTPIALIQGYAEGLKDNVNDDPESRDFYCDVIIDESGKMNKLVRQLLTLNHLESGSEPISMERFDLTQLIHGVLETSHLLIEQSGAEILFDDSRPCNVWGDEFKIEEVVTNYLTNALNHLEGEKKIEIKMEEENGIVKTTVFNTGKPIPEEDIDRIWDKFYKVDKARTRAYGESGIGLSIVKAIMDSHRQKCGVKNYENGVAFWFTLSSRAEL